MASATVDPAEPTSAAPDSTLVDPRAPRFGQSITAFGTFSFIATGNPAPLFVVSAILVLSVLSGWRVDMYGVTWRWLMIPVVGPPDEREPAAPHRFAKLMGATFTAIASILWLVDLVVPAMAVAGMVGILAGVAAILDLCIGCKMYQQVGFFRDLGVV